MGRLRRFGDEGRGTVEGLGRDWGGREVDGKGGSMRACMRGGRMYG